MASSNWCKETDGKINYTKLCRLLVDGGTQAVRSLFDGIHPPSSLKAILNANKTTLQTLKKPRGKVLNDDQWDKLYPASVSDPKSEDFDITLLFVLLRNICGLTPPVYEVTGSGKRKRSWDNLPHKTDNSKEANLVRIKYYRNSITAHKPNTEINDADFEQHWQDISSALLSLGLSQDDIDDLKSDKGMTSQLENLKSDTALIKDDITELKSLVLNKPSQKLAKLAQEEFSKLIESLCTCFYPNTRQWILDQVKSHVNSDHPESYALQITAGPGMGKSVIAAKTCQMYKDRGCLAGCHFFQFSNSTRNNPRLMLQSIARQMCDTVPGYREALKCKLQTDLGKKISEMNCEELFTVLLEEPLQKVKIRGSFVLVLDAIDECCSKFKHELQEVLESKLLLLPSWIRCILTTRPPPSFSALANVKAIFIDPSDSRNKQDLLIYFDAKLKEVRGDVEENSSVTVKLLDISKGLFLIAFFVVDYLQKQKVVDPSNVEGIFLNGLSSVYERYFKRIKQELVPFITKEENVFEMLKAVVASKFPIPIQLSYRILGLKPDRDIPRAEWKIKKDALNSLHSLFPVENDSVTAFHKSIVDWLTREEHYFSVRVEEGDKVLVSQCNDVLRDIRNGKKDLDKPLDLTDSEKYALKYLCMHLVQRHSSVAKTDKQESFSDIYLLIALKIDDINFAEYIRAGVISRSLLEILRCMEICFFTSIQPHKPSCHYFHRTAFGRYLAFVLQAAHAMGVSEETTPNALDVLKEYDFPYFEEKRLLQTPSVEMEGAKQKVAKLLYSLQYVLECKEGFIAVLPMSRQNSLSTAVHVYQRDGRLVIWKAFHGKKLIATSPNFSFIVVAEENGKKIEMLDVTTLEVVSQYEFPHDAIGTCHVFGNDQCWFIVIKGHHDNKVYVIEGLTGRVRNTITVDEGSTVVDVSCQGHIVVTRTWKQHEKLRPFINKDGEVEKMNWRIDQTLFKQHYTYRELILYHYDRAHEPIPIYPLVGKTCRCDYFQPCINEDVSVQLSEDGHLLAYHYKDSIFILNTSDGSLFKRCGSFAGNVRSFSCLHILFVSKSYLMIIDKSVGVMFLINVQTDEIQHRIYVPHPVTLIKKQYLLLPGKDGKSFNLMSSHRTPNYEVSRLEFHNLSLQGFRQKTRLHNHIKLT